MNDNIENGGEGIATDTVKPPLVLDPVEARVLACLIEKDITTPEYYPLTLKALLAACNQKSNRDPVMQLDEADIQEAIESLRYKRRLLWHVDEAGSRVPKYKHAVLDTFPFEPHDLAVLCELMLRGPQTQGELRTHCARLTPFDSMEQVREAIRRLEDWSGTALVTELPAGAGRREPRYAHLLCGKDNLPPVTAMEGSASGTDGGPPRGPSRDERIGALESEVAALRRLIEALQSQVDRLRELYE